MNLLIISNRVLSETDNNGKTLLSLVGNIPKKNVAQLYFYGNLPEVGGYRYFQLSDRDIIKGKLNKKNRGREVFPPEEKGDIHKNSNRTTDIIHIKRNAITLQIRELLWKNAWKSSQLEKWLNEVRPDAIFFMAGDCIYAYDVCDWIRKKYNAKLYTYVTDDYILKRSEEGFFDRCHRKKIFKTLRNCAKSSTTFFTICDRMRETYKSELDVDSEILFNRCESLYDPKIKKEVVDTKKIIFMYAGSLYYGRDRLLIQLAKTLSKINEKKDEKKKLAELHIYSNREPADSLIEELENTGAGYYKGRLDRDELKKKLNQCDFPVFVESFDKEQIEKTRLSFSTKVPEYLSLGKPILAIGPKGIGSMDCLGDAAVCVNGMDDFEYVIEKLVLGMVDMNKYIYSTAQAYQRLMNLDGLESYLE